MWRGQHHKTFYGKYLFHIEEGNCWDCPDQQYREDLSRQLLPKFKKPTPVRHS